MTQISCQCHLHLHQQHFNPSSDGNFIYSIPYLKVFGYLNTTLAAVVGVNMQGTTKQLKETHGVSLYVFLATIIIHYIAFVADKRSQRNQANPSQFCGLIAVISGSLSTISLVSTFFTSAEIICYIALGCAAIIIVVYPYGIMFMNVCRGFYDDILTWYEAINIFSTEQQQLPPV